MSGPGASVSELAATLGISMKRAKCLGIRPDMTPLAYAVIVSMARLQGNLPEPDLTRVARMKPRRKKQASVTPKPLLPKPYTPHKRQCVSCDKPAIGEARRSVFVGWEPVCLDHGMELAWDGKSQLRCACINHLEPSKIHSRRSYERHLEANRERARRKYRAMRDGRKVKVAA